MRKIFLLMLASALALPAMAQKNKKTSSTPAATTKPAPDPRDQEDNERKGAQMANRMIGPMHNMIVQWSGHWREETVLFAASGKKTGNFKGNREGRMVMEGRFLLMNTMGEQGTEPYEGQSVMGWDNGKMVFVKTWYDNLSTGILYLEGVLDQEKNTITFTGTTTDPVTRQPVKVRQVLRILEPSKTVLEIYREDKTGNEYKAMEVTSFRG